MRVFSRVTVQPHPDREADYQYEILGGFISKIKQEDDYGAGHQLALSRTFGYDEVSITSAGILPQHQTSLSSSFGNTRGNLTSVTVGGQATTSIAYDDAGSVLTLTPADGNAPGANPSAWQTTYSYDQTDTYVVGVTRPSTNGISHVSTSTLDPYTGVVIRTNDENSVALGSTLPTIYNYYPYGSSNPGKLQSVVTADGGSTSYAYPNPNQVVTTITRPGNTTETVVDTVDVYGRPMQHTDNGVVTGITYDLSDRQECVTHPYSPWVQNPTDGFECVMAFDGLNRPLTVQHSDGTQKHIAYVGNVINVTDESGHIMSYADNAFGQISHVWEPSQSRISFGVSSWRTDYTYDGLGRLTTIVQNGDGSTPQTRSWVYDGAGNLAQELTPESGLTCFGYLIGSNCTSDYDPDGNVQQKVDANLNVSRYSYDYLDRTTSVTATAPTNGSSVTNTYTYDAAPSGSSFTTTNSVGRLVAQMSSSGTGQVLSYDSVGRVSGQMSCLPSGCATGTNTVGATYNNDGSLSRLTYPDGMQIQNIYNNSGQLLSAGPFNQATYYLSGQLASATISSVTKTVSVNNRFAVTALNYQKPTLAPGGGYYINAPVWNRAFDWDWNGKNINSETDLNAGVIKEYTYDQINRLTGVRESGAGTGSVGSLTLSGADGTHLQCPNTDILPTIASPQTWGLEGLSTWGDDAADFVCTDQSGPQAPPIDCILVFDQGNLEVSIGGFDVSVPYTETLPLSQLAYELAAAINASPGSPVVASTSYLNPTVVSLSSKLQGSITNYALVIPPSNDVQVTPSGPTMTGGTDTGPPTGLQETYSLDPWGNMQQQGNFTFTPSLGISTSNNQIQTATYDNAGNLTMDPLGTQYTYDPLQQLVTTGGGLTFTYDGGGNRVVKSTGGAANEYVYFGQRLIAVHQTATNTWTDFIYANGERVAQATGGANPTYTPIINDLNGSAVALTDVQGNILNQTEYAPYGQVFTSTGNTPAFQFLGMEYHATSLSNDSLTREYSANESRWLSPDSYEGSYDLFNPQSLNRYSYVAGRPTALSDASGMDPDNSDPGCGILCIVEGIYDIWEAFKGGSAPKEPPPHSGVDAMKHLPGGVIPSGLPTHIAILDGLGIPNTPGCEFGGCPNSFQQQGNRTSMDNSGLLSSSVSLPVNPWMRNILTPALTVSYDYKTGLLCAGGGVSVNTPFHFLSFSSGPEGYVVKPGKTEKDMLSGWALFGSITSPVFGLQGSTGPDGAAGGLALGPFGASIGLARSWCTYVKPLKP